MKSLHATTLAIALAVAVPVAAWAQMEHAQHDEAAMIEAADTPEEHRALAEHYRQQASDARTRAEHHRAMGKKYGGGETKRRPMRDHCDELVALYDKVAVEFDRLAEGHEAEAGE